MYVLYNRFQQGMWDTLIIDQKTSTNHLDTFINKRFIFCTKGFNKECETHILLIRRHPRTIYIHPLTRDSFFVHKVSTRNVMWTYYSSKDIHEPFRYICHKNLHFLYKWFQQGMRGTLIIHQKTSTNHLDTSINKRYISVHKVSTRWTYYS